MYLFMYLFHWPLSFCKIKKKIVRANPELWGCAIFLPKMAHLSWTKKFWYNPLLFLSSTYWSFSLCKILKNFCCGSRVMRMHHFWPKMIHLPKTIFFWKLLILFSSTYYLLSLGKILKKFFQRIQLWGCAIFGPKIAHSPYEFFFSENLLMSLVSFIHAYLHAKNQSQILVY